MVENDWERVWDARVAGLSAVLGKPDDAGFTRQKAVAFIWRRGGVGILA